MKKTRLEWLNSLPLQTRLQVIENARKEGNTMAVIKENAIMYSIWEAIAGLFIFEFSRQGHEYWILKLQENGYK